MCLCIRVSVCLCVYAFVCVCVFHPTQIQPSESLVRVFTRTRCPAGGRHQQGVQKN